MTQIHRFSERVIDLAERFEDVADAANGKGRRSGGKASTRFIVLPAAGAALYAVAKSEFVARRTKDVVSSARTRASELPDDLLKSVRQTQKAQSSNRSGNQRRNSGSSSGKTSSSRRSSRRKTTSSAR
jgi:hypothetical protein